MNVRKKVPPSLLPTQSITSGLSAEEQLLGLAKMSAKKGASAFRKRIKRLLAENHSSAKLYQIAGTIEASYGSREQALCHFKIAKSLNPVDSTIHRDLGTLLSELGRYAEARSSFKSSLKLNANQPSACLSIATTYREENNQEEARKWFGAAIELDPNSSVAHCNLANTLLLKGDNQKACEHYEVALKIDPKLSAALHGLGVVHLERGAIEDAKLFFERANELDTTNAGTMYELSKLRKYNINDQFTKSLFALDARSVPNDKQVLLHFARAKVLEDNKLYKEAYSSYSKANKARGKINPFDLEKQKTLFAKIKNLFQTYKQSGNSIARPLTPSLNETKTPIFILGMPRSGTTLVEQIISMHQEVQALGELSLLTESIDKQINFGTDLDQRTLNNIRAKYLHDVGVLSPGKLFFTDKMPLNFRWLGFICAAFPEAKIVYTKRDARAVCWSNFKANFDQPGLGFSNDLRATAQYFQMHLDLMDFWLSSFSDRIILLDYEKLTEDPEMIIRKLIGDLGLSWTDEFLQPQNNAGVVRTMSITQVRNPIYKGSSRAWQNFEPHIGTAFENLPTTN